jgi:2-polyprenyl-3-methyl-5-hydroxy-6-metoxy-1,4-benzoquinol methylase
MWLFPVPTLDDLREVYSQDYFSNPNFLSNSNELLFGYTDYISERINKQYGYRGTVHNAITLLGSDIRGAGERKWLDVGCGLGYLLDVAFDHGFAVKGLEFNPTAVAKLRAKYTFPVATGGVETLDESEQFDVISLLDVIEHLRNPFEDLTRLRQAINPGGVLIVSTMDSDSIVSRLLGKRLEDFRRTREHLYFFSRETIQRTLEKHGWETVQIRSIGHTFQLGALLDRTRMISPLLGGAAKAIVYPRWLLDANLYLNPGTKMIVFARPR